MGTLVILDYCTFTNIKHIYLNFWQLKKCIANIYIVDFVEILEINYAGIMSVCNVTTFLTYHKGI